MGSVDPALRGKLQNVADALALDIPTAQLDTLLHYLALLQRWNATYNLTSVRDPDQMLSLHLADCLAMIEPLRRHLGALLHARVLDVGSGAGLPGVVIAAVNSSTNVTCIDTVGKKTAFIQQVAAELGLHNLNAVHARVEQWQATPFDVVTSRAFASLADFVALTRTHLAPGGVWLAMKGKHPADELASLPSDIDVFHVEQLTVPTLDAERCLVWMKVAN